LAGDMLKGDGAHRFRAAAKIITGGLAATAC